MIAKIILPLVPLRKSDSECSEMCTQLLFGENIEIVEERERWLLVRNISDNYLGWVDRKMVFVENGKSESPDYNLSHCVNVPVLACTNIESNEQLFLPGGSILHQFADNQFLMNESYFSVASTYLISTTKDPICFAKQYLNAPYLWGGKSIFGIDCSGLVQVVYSMLGIQLPRDASQQVDKGKIIDFLSEVKSGDLAFFANNEDKITHVGILINSSLIIHASGWVKIESIDSQGIISNATGVYTHKLRVIKRILK